jgi:hypothetical protein
MNEVDQPLPELFQSRIDEATLKELFTDLQAVATITSVRLKRSAEVHADPGPVTLNSALAAFHSRTASGIQISYVYQGANWIDTLVLQDEAILLTRIQTR